MLFLFTFFEVGFDAVEGSGGALPPQETFDVAEQNYLCGRAYLFSINWACLSKLLSMKFSSECVAVVACVVAGL